MSVSSSASSAQKFKVSSKGLPVYENRNTPQGIDSEPTSYLSQQKRLGQKAQIQI